MGNVALLGISMSFLGQLMAVLLLHLLAIDGVEGAVPEYALTDKELKIEAGYYTESGKYRGGIPKFNEIPEVSVCSENNATICMEWDSKESDNDDEYYVCGCQTPIDGYCYTWTCSVVKANDADECSEDCYDVLAAETTRCTCKGGDTATTSTAVSEYCGSWECVESFVDGSTHTNFEKFVCKEVSASGRYCSAWTGELITNDEVSATVCGCVEGNAANGCTAWECMDKRISKCGGVCSIGLAVGFAGTFGLLLGYFLLSSLKSGPGPCSVILFVLVLACASGAVLWGGQDGAMYVAIMWGIPLVVFALCWFTREKE